MSAIMPDALADRLSRIKSMSAKELGFDDRDHLSFGDHVVEFDQNCLDFPGYCRCHRDFHFHRFDESNLVAVADTQLRLLPQARTRGRRLQSQS